MLWLKADEQSGSQVAVWQDGYQNELTATNLQPAVVTNSNSPFLRTVQFGPNTPLRPISGRNLKPQTLLNLNPNPLNPKPLTPLNLLKPPLYLYPLAVWAVSGTQMAPRCHSSGIQPS